MTIGGATESTYTVLELSCMSKLASARKAKLLSILRKDTSETVLFYFKTTASVSIELIRYKFQHYLASRLPTLYPLECLLELVDWVDTVKCRLSNP
jgi:hypothetical protein